MKNTCLSLYHIVLLACICVFSSCKTPSMLVSREQQTGDKFSNQFDYKQATVHYKNALEASRQAGIYQDPDVEAGICRKLSYVNSATGNYDEALKYIYIALSLDSASNNKLSLIGDYRSAGMIYLFKGDFFNGIPMLEKALGMVTEIENSIKGINQKTVADTYLSIAEANAVLGRFNASENYALKSQSIYKNLDDPRGLMETWLLLGNVNKDKGDLNTAIIRLNISLGLAAKNGYNTARHHQALGEVYSANGEYEKALNEKIDALEEAEKSKIQARIAWATIGVGDAYYDIGDIQKADNYFKRAIGLMSGEGSESLALEASAEMRTGDVAAAQRFYTGIKSGVAAGIASLRMGELMLEEGKADSAYLNFNLAGEYFGKSGVKEGEALALLGKSLVEISKQEYTGALSLLNRCLELSSQEETQWQVYYRKGQVMVAMGRMEEGINAYKKSVEIIESIRGNFTIDEFKSKYIENKVKVYDELINILMQGGKVDDAFEYSERARSRAFLDMIGNRQIAVKPGTDSLLLKKEQELRMQIQTLTQRMQVFDLEESRELSERQVKEELRSSREEYMDLINLIKMESPEYASMVVIEPSNYKSLQAGMDSETLVLNYWVGEKMLFIWLISKDSMLSYTVNTSKAEIDHAVNNSRTLINRTSEFQDGYGSITGSAGQTSDNAVAQFRKDYDMLISPVVRVLKNYRNICIIPHGSLHLLPFQACIDPMGKFLVENYNLFYAPSISVYEQCLKKNQRAGKEFLALALGDLSIGEFTGLPGTRWEVERISSLFDNPTVRYESQSTESFLKENATKFNIIHLSTHGMMNADMPLFSFVLLNPEGNEDGLLTVTEVFGLNLDARLVTLSACETGLGKINMGDEIVGLSRAFIYAGASSVVVSLWKVADQPTALLMSKFYMYQRDHDLPEALSMAQRDVMKEYYAPFYWAPFQLIGKGN